MSYFLLNLHQQALQREAGPCIGVCHGHHRQHVWGDHCRSPPRPLHHPEPSQQPWAAWHLSACALPWPRWGCTYMSQSGMKTVWRHREWQILSKSYAKSTLSLDHFWNTPLSWLANNCHMVWLLTKMGRSVWMTQYTMYIASCSEAHCGSRGSCAKFDKTG